MVGFRMPTRAQLRATYKGIVSSKAQNGTLKPMSTAPAQLNNASEFKNVGIKEIRGKEDIYALNGQLFVKNTKSNGKVSWLDAGNAPVFAQPLGR